MGAYSPRPTVVERLIGAAAIVGVVYLLGLGFWAATGKLHILARSGRLLDGLVVGATIVGAVLYLWRQARAEGERERELHATEMTEKVHQALAAGYALGAQGTYAYHDKLRTSPLYLDSLDDEQRELLRTKYPRLIRHLPPHEREKAEQATQAGAATRRVLRDAVKH